MIEAKSPAEAAAKWWAEQVVDPVHRMARPGEGDESTIFGEGLLGMLSDRHPVTREQADRFAEILQAKIEAWTNDPDGAGLNNWFVIMTDYGPDKILGDAAEQAGIHRSRLPIKSGTAMTSNYVVTNPAYSRRVLIWSREGWDRPVCGDHRTEGPDHFTPTDDTCRRLAHHEGECGDWQHDPTTCTGCGLTYAGHYDRDVPREKIHSWYPSTEQVEEAQDG